MKESIMDDLKAIYNEYKNIPKERARSNRKHKEELAKLRAEIARLTFEHTEYWAERKDKVREALDAHALAALNAGHNPNEILNAIGSRNPTWIYGLKSRPATENPVAALESTHPLLSGVEWDYSEHVGSHGVLRSADGDYFKLYNLKEPTQFCIVDADLAFVTGSNALYESRSRAELERLTDMLSSLLDGTYQGAVRFRDNKYTS